MSDGKLPTQIGEGVIEAFGMKLRVAVLDNGERLILEEDFDSLMQKLADEAGPQLDLTAEHWKARFEDEKRDHEATIKHAERERDEYSA